MPRKESKGVEARIPAKRESRSSRRVLDSEWKLAYSLKEAGEATGLSPETIRRAMHTTDWKSFPPPMYGKRAGRKYIVLKTELVRWLESLPDA